MRTIYESILESILGDVDVQADAFGKKIEIEEWIRKCAGNTHKSVYDIKAEVVNGICKITHKRDYWLGFAYVIDDTFESLPPFEIVSNRRDNAPIFECVKVTAEVSPDIIFEKYQEIAFENQWEFYDCSADYIEKLLTKLKSTHSSSDILIKIYNPKGNCDFTKLSNICDGNFHLGIEQIQSDNRDILLPADVLRSLCNIHAKSVTLDADVTHLPEISEDSKGKFYTFNINQSTIDRLKIINEPKDIPVVFGIRNSKIGNMKELAESSYIYDASARRESGILLNLDRKTRKLSHFES